MFNPQPKPVKKKKTSKVDEWANVRRKLKPVFQNLGITTCEMCTWEHKKGYATLSPSLGGWALGFAHRHKRDWYLGQSELLGDLAQVILACQMHHGLIEHDKALTEQWFERLRGPEC